MSKETYYSITPKGELKVWLMGIKTFYINANELAESKKPLNKKAIQKLVLDAQNIVKGLSQIQKELEKK